MSERSAFYPKDVKVTRDFLLQRIVEALCDDEAQDDRADVTSVIYLDEARTKVRIIASGHRLDLSLAPAAR